VAQGVRANPKLIQRIRALRAAGIPVHRTAVAVAVTPSTVVKYSTTALPAVTKES
jgi:hypothetical protein